MSKILKFIKDVIYLLKNPPGVALRACEITPDTVDFVTNIVGSEGAPYVKYGDFLVEFENLVTVVPAKEFHKNYAILGFANGEMKPVIDIKNLAQRH